MGVKTILSSIASRITATKRFEVHEETDGSIAFGVADAYGNISAPAVTSTTDPLTGGSTLSATTSTLKLPAGTTDLSLSIEKYRIKKIITNWGATMVLGRWDGASTSGATRQAFNQTDVAEAPYDAVQFAYPNGTAATCTINGAAFISVANDNKTPIYDGNTEGNQVVPTPWSSVWTDITFSGVSATVTPAVIPARSTNYRPGWLQSDVLKLINLDPLTDSASLTGNPKGLPLVISKLQCNAGNKEYNFYNGYANWDTNYAANYGQGRIHNVAFISPVTSTSNYASTASIFQWVTDGKAWTSINGTAYIPKFRYQGRCIQVLGIGDSLTAGSSEVCGAASPEFRACATVSTQNTPVAYLNAGLSGLGFSTFTAYADDLMPVFDPDVLIISMGSPNDSGSWGALAQWDNLWISQMDYINSSTVTGANRLPIIATLAPFVDPSTWDPIGNVMHAGWLRHYNRCLALANRGFIVWDRAAPVSVSGSPGKWVAGLCSGDPSIPVGVRSANWYHPSEAGILLQLPGLVSILNKIVTANF
jgi:hypothetical protein